RISTTRPLFCPENRDKACNVPEPVPELAVLPASLKRKQSCLNAQVAEIAGGSTIRSMQRKSNATRTGMIEEAIALFVRNEAALLVQVAETNKALAEGERRFGRIEADLEQIKAILHQLTAAVERHERILADLPDAVRQKIGFEAKP